MLIFLSICSSQILAQTPCGAGQKFRTIRHGVTLLPASTATSLVYGGSQPAMGCVTTTKTDIVSSLGGSLQYNYASGSYANNLASGAPAGLLDPANDGGGTRITMWNGNETDLVYTFAAPVTDPILFVGGVGTIGLYTGASIEVVGKTVTKLGGDPNFNVAGSTITNNGASVTTLQRGYVKISGTMTTFTLKLKSTTCFYGYQWFDIHVGACYSPPPAATPCPGKELWTATHSASTPTTSHAQMKNGNSIVINKTDIVGASSLAGSALYADTYTNGVLQCFPNGGDYVKGGGYVNLTTLVGGTTEMTYTFCNPVTDPFVFFGWVGISAGGEVAFDKPIDIMDAEDGFAKVAAQSVGVCGSDLYQNGYVKVKGTFTSFKMTFKSGPTWNQIFTVMVGECTDVTPKAAVAQPVCIPTATQKYVNFNNTAIATADFILKDDSNVAITNEFGGAVKANITKAAPDACGPFSNVTTLLLGKDNVQGVVKAGDGYSYTYKFNSPVKGQISSEVYNSYALAYSELVIIEAKKGGVAVNVSGSISGSALGLMTTAPGNPKAVMFQGGWGGNLWKAWPDSTVDEITITYKSNNNDAYIQEPHRIAICSAPCAITYPACAAANQRTEAFGFTSSSPTMATGSKGTNNVTLTTTANVPILAAAGAGASTMNECGDANKQMAVSSGGWVLVGAKANKTGEKITYNFTKPVTNPIVLVWGIYYSTKLDVAGVSTCLKPIRSWYGATVGLGLTPGTTDQTAITGTFGLAGIGYYQIPGTFTSLTFDVETGIYENWFYMSIGEGVCSPPVENLTAPTPTALTCTSPTGSLKTYDANFDYIISAYKTVSGKMYDPKPSTTSTPAAAGYPAGVATTVNDVTVDCSQNNSYWLGLYGLTSYPAGQVPASAGCTPDSAPFASAGGGAVYAYTGIGSQGTGLWATPGIMTWTMKNEVVNPIIKVKYLSWTKLTFKDCDGNIIPIATIPGSFKGGLTSSGSSIFTNGTGLTNAPFNNSEWLDGLEGEGAVQLIGRFKKIDIVVEKTGIWGDYWSITLAQPVCTSSAPPTVVCDAVIPTCPMASAGPTPPASSGNPTTVASTFTKTAYAGAIGSLSVGGKPVVVGLVSTSEVLSANTDRAPSTFNDPICYSVPAVGGGAVTIKDIGGNNTTTITFNRAIQNPLIYIKDLTRLELDFGTTLDINGSAVCCMKQISGSNGLTTTGTKVADNNPTEAGSPSVALTPGCGLIQLVGTFNNIVIKSSRPSGTTLFNDWTLSIGGEAVCVPNSVIASLGAAPQDPSNPTIPPTVIVTPSTSAPTPVSASKAISNIRPKNPANPAGNQIVTYSVVVKNTSLTKINNLFIADKFDDKYVPGVVVTIAQAPTISFATGTSPKPNATFNGTSVTDLLDMSVNNMLASLESVTIVYAVEINPTLIPSGIRHNNNLAVGSTTMTLKVSNVNGNDLNAPIAVPFYPPAAIQLAADREVTICNGAAPVEFAKFVQSQGGAKVTNNAVCGAINWSFSWVEDKSKTYCGGTYGRIVTFRGLDACQNVYEFNAKFSTTDNCPPIFDMLPMDKTVSCDDANVLAKINMWLSATGDAWFGDPGHEKGLVTSTNDYKVVGCVPGVYPVKFTITDGCSNKADATATLTVKATSTVNSTIVQSKMDDKTIACENNMNFDVPTFTTTCSGGIKSKTYVDKKIQGVCITEYAIARTWTVEDACGSIYKTTQIINMVDNQAPMFDPTLSKAVKMKKASYYAWRNMYFKAFVKATDNCSFATIATPTYTQLNPKTVEAKTTAKDECGNLATYTCKVTFSDVQWFSKEDGNADLTLDPNHDITENTVEYNPSDLVIFPNPSSNILNISTINDFGQMKKVIFHTIDGRTALSVDVENQNTELITIDINSLITGHYLLEMQYDNKRLYRVIEKSEN